MAARGGAGRRGAARGGALKQQGYFEWANKLISETAAQRRVRGSL